MSSEPVISKQPRALIESKKPKPSKALENENHWAKRFKCPLCVKRFSNDPDMKRHLEQVCKPQALIKIRSELKASGSSNMSGGGDDMTTDSARPQASKVARQAPKTCTRSPR